MYLKDSNSKTKTKTAVRRDGTMLRVPQSWRRMGRVLANYSPHQPGGSGVEPGTFGVQV